MTLKGFVRIKGEQGSILTYIVGDEILLGAQRGRIIEVGREGGRRMTFTQPVCDYCWRFKEGDREPVRMKNPETERCSNCGISTTSGIYIRIDPKTVRFPIEEKDL